MASVLEERGEVPGGGGCPPHLWKIGWIGVLKRRVGTDMVEDL